LEHGDVRANARRFGKILEASDDIVTLLSGESRVCYVTRSSFEAATGIPVEKYVGAHATEWLHPDDRATIGARLDELIAAGAGARARAEFRHRRIDGSWTWFESVACNLLDDPDVSSIVVTTRKIDDAVRLREELRRANELYETAMRMSREAVWERNLVDGSMTFSPAVSALAGYHADELPATIGDSWHFMHPDDVPAQEAHIAALLRGEPVGDSEMRVRHKNGEFRWFRINREIHRHATGEAYRLVAHITDIHDQKAAQAARAEVEARARVAAIRDELVGEISRRFLDEESERALDAVLERVGTTLEFERVSVFASDSEGRRLTCTHRWRAPGIEMGWESLEAYPVPAGAFDRFEVTESARTERSNAPLDDWLATLQREAARAPCTHRLVTADVSSVSSSVGCETRAPGLKTTPRRSGGSAR
jgi:PAS domain S-box-containing protein